MEKPGLLKWVEGPIDFKTYFDEFQSIIPVPTGIKKTRERDHQYALRKFVPVIMGVELTDHQFKELMKYCGEDKLYVPGEPPLIDEPGNSRKRSFLTHYQIPPGEFELATLNEAKHREKDKVFLKYAASARINRPLTVQGEWGPEKDLVIFLKVYQPYRCFETKKCKPRHFSEEFAVLGSQPLSSLRDCISCPNDMSPLGDVSNCPDAEVMMRAKDLFKSGFFFINNTFYNDFRCAANIDYCAEIVKWADKKGLGPLRSASMSETLFRDLKVYFGYPYAYLHQGNCEHVIVFADARLLHESDKCSRKNYPMLVSVGIRRRITCSVCHENVARWVTRENERTLHDPMFFCQKCFKSFNYVDGKKVGNFKAYQYFSV